MYQQFKISWIDKGTKPQNPPDLHYPHGRDIDSGVRPACRVELPYPYQPDKCGMFVIECRKCGLRTVLTTAGRPDDPRSYMATCLHRKVQ